MSFMLYLMKMSYKEGSPDDRKLHSGPADSRQSHRACEGVWREYGGRDSGLVCGGGGARVNTAV